MAKYTHTTARKYMGDDSHSWAVFSKHTGRCIVDGCCAAERNYHRQRIENDMATDRRDRNGKLQPGPPMKMGPSCRKCGNELTPDNRDDACPEDGNAHKE